MSTPNSPLDPEKAARIRAIAHQTEEIVDLGWRTLRDVKQKNNVYVSEKEHFFAGAGFVFDAIVYAMSPEDDPTIEDMRLLTKLHEELTKFNEGFTRKFPK